MTVLYTLLLKYLVELSTYDILVNETEIEETLQKTMIKNLKVCPATINLAGAEVELVPMMSHT